MPGQPAREGSKRTFSSSEQRKASHSLQFLEHLSGCVEVPPHILQHDADVIGESGNANSFHIAIDSPEKHVNNNGEQERAERTSLTNTRANIEPIPNQSPKTNFTLVAKLQNKNNITNFRKEFEASYHAMNELLADARKSGTEVQQEDAPLLNFELLVCARASNLTMLEPILLPGRKPCWAAEIQPSIKGSQARLKKLAMRRLSLLTIINGRTSPRA